MTAVKMLCLVVIKKIEGLNLLHEVDLVFMPGEWRGGLNSVVDRLSHGKRKDYKASNKYVFKS